MVMEVETMAVAMVDMDRVDMAAMEVAMVVMVATEMTTMDMDKVAGEATIKATAMEATEMRVSDLLTVCTCAVSVHILSKKMAISDIVVHSLVCWGFLFI